MSKKVKKPTSFAIINGQKVSADTGRSLDGFARSAQPSPITKPASKHHLDLSAHKKASAQPTRKPAAAARGIDGLGSTGATKHHAARQPKKPAATQVHARHSAQASRAAHAQRTAAQRHHARKAAQQQAAATKKQVQPRNEAKVDHTKHIVPQSARLTEARHQRARMYRQSSTISKFGARRHNTQLAAPAAEASAAPAQKEESDTVDLHSMIESLRQPVAHINHEIAQHHQRHSQHARDTAAEKKAPLLKRAFQSQKFIASAATVASMALLVGYTAYLNAPNIAMRVAASRAGVEAQMPGYVPSGFALDGPIKYTDGRVVVTFGSNSDHRTFALTQEESNWDSASLRANLASTTSNQINEISQGGLTVFIYDGSNASWVDGGIRYHIEGSSLLSAEQLASIAASL